MDYAGGGGGSGRFKRPVRRCSPGKDGGGLDKDAGGRKGKAWMDARAFPEINHNPWR